MKEAKLALKDPRRGILTSMRDAIQHSFGSEDYILDANIFGGAWGRSASGLIRTVFRLNRTIRKDPTSNPPNVN